MPGRSHHWEATFGSFSIQFSYEKKTQKILPNFHQRHYFAPNSKKEINKVIVSSFLSSFLCHLLKAIPKDFFHGFLLLSRIFFAFTDFCFHFHGFSFFLSRFFVFAFTDFHSSVNGVFVCFHGFIKSSHETSHEKEEEYRY